MQDEKIFIVFQAQVHYGITVQGSSMGWYSYAVLLGSKFELTRCGRMLQAIIMFVYGINTSNVNWSFDKIVTVVFMIIGGVAVFLGLFLVYAALCFFTLEGLEFMNVFTDGGREFGRYPIGIYGKRILQFCTFIIPYALVQYYPLLYLLERIQDRYKQK